MAAPCTVLSFEDWQREQEEAKLAKAGKRAKAPKYITPYDPSTEARPDLPWYHLDKANIDSQFQNIAQQVLDEIADARLEDKEMISLRKVAEQIAHVSRSNARETALVGMQGVGKSLLINALLDRRNLSKTSAEGAACTASAIKYLHKPGVDDSTEIYDVEIQFMDDEHLQEIADEHARRYRYYYLTNREDQEITNDDQEAAKTANEFFSIIFDSANDADNATKLNELLTESEIQSGGLVRETIKMAHQRFKENDAAGNRVKAFADVKAADLLSRIDGFVAPHETRPSLWPIVQHVRIFIGSTLTRNGVAIIDLPGLGDLNQSRTAATNAIRREADFEVIVAKSERVVTDEAVDRQLRQAIRAHGAKNTVLVLTKIDEYLQDDHHIDGVIRTKPVPPFPEIKAYMALAEDRILQLDQDDEDPETVEQLEHYCAYLKRTAQIAFIQYRAELAKNKMRDAFADLDPTSIDVFPISASMYLQWMKPRQKEAPILNTEMTGIPSLRRFLLGISAQDNFRAYQEHACTKLPLFLEKVSRITDEDRKDDAYAAIRPAFAQAVEDLKVRHLELFSQFLAEEITEVFGGPSMKAKRLERITHVVEMWAGGVVWNTYNKALRQKGIVKQTTAAKYKDKGGQFNWNEEISQELVQDMEKWRRKMNPTVTIIALKLTEVTKSACSEILAFILQSTLAPALKAIAVEEWKKQSENVTAQAKMLEGLLKAQVRATYQFATTETDTRCMMARLNWSLYESIESIPRGEGFFHRQREAMMSTLTKPDENGNTILDKFSNAVRKEARRNLKRVFTNCVDDVVGELMLFDEHIGERLPPDYEITSVDRHIRNSLRAKIPILKTQVKAIQDILSPMTTKEDSEGSEAPEPLTKKKKTEEEPRAEDPAQQETPTEDQSPSDL